MQVLTKRKHWKYFTFISEHLLLVEIIQKLLTSLHIAGFCLKNLTKCYNLNECLKSFIFHFGNSLGITSIGLLKFTFYIEVVSNHKDNL